MRSRRRRATSRRLVGQVRAAIDGGARLVQYRAKHLRGPRSPAPGAGASGPVPRAGRPLHRERRPRTRAPRSPRTACTWAATTQTRERRAMRLPDAILGVSCYDDPARAVAAAAAGADYVGIGSVFASSTKPHAVRSGLAAISRGQAHRAPARGRHRRHHAVERGRARSRRAPTCSRSSRRSSTRPTWPLPRAHSPAPFDTESGLPCTNEASSCLRHHSASSPAA